MNYFEVLLGDTMVGYLGRAADGKIAFRFNDAYLRTAPRAVLGQNFEDDLEKVYVGRKPGQLPAFFANLLPEGRLRTVIVKSLALDDPSDLELLFFAESDLPGAVRLRATEELAGPGTQLSIGEDTSGLAGDELGLRFSLAGAQLKFSAIHTNDRFTVPAHDVAGEWIVKVSIGDFPGLAENEFTVLQWARAAGFDVPVCRLVQGEEIGELRKYMPENTKVLAVQRYDRSAGRRIHQEDFNQVLGRVPRADGQEKYDFTYEQLAFLIGSIAGDDAADEFVRRLIFVIASGNSDAHLKNWSLLYKDGIHPGLTPMYDQVSTIAWPRLDKRLALKLAGTREFGRVGRDSIQRVAVRLGRKPEKTNVLIEDTLVAIRKAWRELDSSAMEREHVKALEEHWSQVPILREYAPLRA